MKPEDENLYKPDSAATPDEIPAKAAPSSPTISWTASEYIEHKHGASWYSLLALGTAGLAAVTYFMTKDYFATGTIVILGIIVGAFAGRKPGQIAFELSDSGLSVGPKTYNFNLFKSFGVIQEGHLASISLTPVKRFMPPVSAYFDPKDQQKIVDAIGKHLPYEERKPGAVDRLSFRLKL